MGAALHRPSVAAGLCGLALAVLPTLPWYAAEVADRTETARGLEGSGELWILPILGVLALATATAAWLVTIKRGRGAAGLGAGLAWLALGAAATAWCARALADPAVVLVVVGEPGPPLPVEVSREPAGFVALGAAVALALLGLGVVVAALGRALLAERRPG